MNIGVNARLLLADRVEGLARYTLETTNQMAKDHPEDEFYLFFDRPFSPEFLPFDNMHGEVINLPTRHPMLILAWFEWLLPSRLKALKIDVFYSADNFCSLRAKIPSCVVCHDLAYLAYGKGLRWDYLLFYKLFMPKYLRKADHIVTVSSFVKKDIVSKFSISGEKISVAYNALPTRTVGKSTIYAIQKPYFVFVGSLHPRKNIVNLIKAFNLFLKESALDFELVIIGKLAWQSTDIKNLMHSPSVKHLLNVKDEELMPILRNAVAMVYPSFFEGFGIPILEGFAAEIPVITSNISSMPEVGGDAALLVDPYDFKEIASAMQIIATDRKLRFSLIEKGKERLLLYDWKVSAKIIYNSLDKLHHPSI